MTAMTRLLAAACVLSVTFAGLAMAAPVVSSIAGDTSSGGALTITGSGFGVGDTTPLLWDDFEDGTNGANLNGSPKVGTWVLLDTGSLAKYSSTKAHSGSLSSHAADSDGSSFRSQFSCSFPHGDNRFYASFWFQRIGNQGTGQTKLFQLWGTYKVGDYNPGVMSGGFSGEWFASYITLESIPGGGYDQQSWYTGAPSKNVWHRFEAILEQSDPNVSNGNVILVVDGQDIFRHENAKTREQSNQYWDELFYFYGYTNVPAGSGMENYIDDAYLNNSWSRVEIGNASSWDACAHKEIQIPSAWSAGSITVTVNQGSFANGTPAYLYVVDQDGNANAAGYPITIGGPVMYNLSVTNGSGDGQYTSGTVVDIAADPAPSGRAFGMWVGNTTNVADTTAASTTVTMPATDVSITAGYVWVYHLTVNSGTGDGQYTAGTVVDISADPAPSGKTFDQWTGDVANVADTTSASTTVTMPAAAVEVTATYKVVAIPGDLDGDGFVGQNDLDIVLDQWGCGDPPADPITDGRADPSGDGFVGQDDLDIVLDHWGEGLPQQ